MVSMGFALSYAVRLLGAPEKVVDALNFVLFLGKAWDLIPGGSSMI